MFFVMYIPTLSSSPYYLHIIFISLVLEKHCGTIQTVFVCSQNSENPSLMITTQNLCALLCTQVYPPLLNIIPFRWFQRQAWGDSGITMIGAFGLWQRCSRLYNSDTFVSTKVRKSICLYVYGIKGSEITANCVATVHYGTSEFKTIRLINIESLTQIKANVIFF